MPSKRAALSPFWPSGVDLGAFISSRLDELRQRTGWSRLQVPLRLAKRQRRSLGPTTWPSRTMWKKRHSRLLDPQRRANGRASASPATRAHRMVGTRVLRSTTRSSVVAAAALLDSSENAEARHLADNTAGMERLRQYRQRSSGVARSHRCRCLAGAEPAPRIRQKRASRPQLLSPPERHVDDRNGDIVAVGSATGLLVLQTSSAVLAGRCLDDFPRCRDSARIGRALRGWTWRCMWQ